jgi:hypothetical protein
MGVDAIDQTICPEVLGMTKCSIASENILISVISLMKIQKYFNRESVFLNK